MIDQLSELKYLKIIYSSWFIPNFQSINKRFLIIFKIINFKKVIWIHKFSLKLKIEKN